MSFPGPIGSKRRRMRSGGSVTANPTEVVENVSEQKTAQTSKCKGANTIPIFLKSKLDLNVNDAMMKLHNIENDALSKKANGTGVWPLVSPERFQYRITHTSALSTLFRNVQNGGYLRFVGGRMVEFRTDDGEMFVVKDPDLFASEVIPQYFDHNKFSSFARQLNFYGFRKMQAKPIKNSDYDAGTAKHVTFYNENFKRGRCDLLKKIQRSTRGGGTGAPSDQSKEIASLKEQVATLENTVRELQAQSDDRFRRLELDMLSRMEQMMMAAHNQLGSTSGGGSGVTAGATALGDIDGLGFGRGSSISSAVNSVANAVAAGGGVFPSPRNSITVPATSITATMPPAAAPTLPPHPKQKQLSTGELPTGGAMPAPPNRLNSLRGLSTLRSISGLSRGASLDSTGSAVFMRHGWEDKIFSQIMLDNNNEHEGTTETIAIENPAFVSNDSIKEQVGAEDDNMSDVSNPEMRQ